MPWMCMEVTSVTLWMSQGHSQVKLSGIKVSMQPLKAWQLTEDQGMPLMCRGAHHSTCCQRA